MTTKQQQRQEVFDTHLPYEIIRLIEQYALLLNPAEYCSGLKFGLTAAVHDGLLVAFCSHARNLLEFFFRDPGHADYAAATDYADGYAKLDLSKDPDALRLYKQLCAQINHLTYNRTDDNKKKIGPPEWRELINIILREATRLAPQLKSGYEKQHLRVDDLTEAKGQRMADRSFLVTEQGGTTSVAPSEVSAVFFRTTEGCAVKSGGRGKRASSAKRGRGVTSAKEAPPVQSRLRETGGAGVDTSTFSGIRHPPRRVRSSE